MTLLAAVSVAVGMHIGAKGARRDRRNLRTELEVIDIDRAFQFMIFCFGISVACEALISVLPPLRQQLQAASNIAWTGQFLFFALAISRRVALARLIAVIVVNAAIGFTGYFSEFKLVFFVLFIAWFTVRDRLNARELGAVTAGFAAMLLLGVIWSHVKIEFRYFQNAGTGQQVVMRSASESLAKMAELAAGMDAADYLDGATLLTLRLSYVDFFSDVLGRVPAYLPHENGALIGAAFDHVLRPRSLFPDKASLPSDSEMTMYYTGRRLASSAQGTSINIGLPGEAYIDAGPWLMFPLLGLLGVAIGAAYRLLTGPRSGFRLWGYGLAVGALLQAHAAPSFLKGIGGTLSTFIVFVLILYVATPYVKRFLLPGYRPTQRRRFAR